MIQDQTLPGINPNSRDEATSLTLKHNSIGSSVNGVTDLLCFSHLRWNFVYQRPQHLLSRASKQFRVWFIEEPIHGPENRLEIRPVNEHLTVVVPHLQHGTHHDEALRQQRESVDQLIAQNGIKDFIAWYYTPMALAFSDHLTPRLTIYDCMDELSAFLGAPASLLEQEKNLLKRADLVFTGGLSLYEAKQSRHPNVFAFPSSIDYKHFEPARQNLPDPADMAAIPSPRVGFCGVIDERMNIALLGELATQRPDWQFVLLGPIVKINPASLPKAANIHYLGFKNYQDLPAYFSNWNAAIMPFAINEATRFISPTKTPEYLAAGLPVVSTTIHDVVSTYGGWSPVRIADTAEAFGKALETVLNQGVPEEEKEAADQYLLTHSWDSTWDSMNRIIQTQLALVLQ